MIPRLSSVYSTARPFGPVSLSRSGRRGAGILRLCRQARIFISFSAETCWLSPTKNVVGSKPFPYHSPSLLSLSFIKAKAFSEVASFTPYSPTSEYRFVLRQPVNHSFLSESNHNDKPLRILLPYTAHSNKCVRPLATGSACFLLPCPNISFVLDCSSCFTPRGCCPLYPPVSASVTLLSGRSVLKVAPLSAVIWPPGAVYPAARRGEACQRSMAVRHLC